MRDLLVESAAVWQAEQARVATQGWGARLLAEQDDAGRWTPRLYGRKWVSTTYSMILLWRLGLPPHNARVTRACELFLNEGLWADGGINLSATQHRSESCITGMVLGLLSWFNTADGRRERLVDYLIREQLPDGGWNCQRDRGAPPRCRLVRHGTHRRSEPMEHPARLASPAVVGADSQPAADHSQRSQDGQHFMRKASDRGFHAEVRSFRRVRAGGRRRQRR
jgi:hypothetical protein